MGYSSILIDTLPQAELFVQLSISSHLQGLDADNAGSLIYKNGIRSAFALHCVREAAMNEQVILDKYMKRWFKGLGKVLIRFCLLAMAGWATLAILFSNLPGFLRPWIAGIFAIGSLVSLVGRYSNRRARLGFLAAFAIVLVWWLLMPPSNNRNWQPDVAVLPWAEIQGTSVIIHNIRNCEYRSESDYTVRHYDRTFVINGAEYPFRVHIDLKSV